MLTLLTKAAIVILSNIYMGVKQNSHRSLMISSEDAQTLFYKLIAAGLIRPVDALKDEYRLTRLPAEISLLDILEAIDEPLDCGKELAEDFYVNYGRAAQKLAVINQVARTYLKQIKLYDL